MPPLGYGGQSNGMGRVGIAYAQDAFAPTLNPAGLSDLCNRVDIDFSWTWREGRAQLEFNNVFVDRLVEPSKSDDDL